MNQQFHLIDDQRKQNMLYYCRELQAGKGYIITITKEEKPRTAPQNNALHKYFELLAVNLNDSGQDKIKTFAAMKKGVSLPWSRDSIKEDLWRPIQEAVTGEKSTTKLTTKQVSEIYEILNRFTAERLGVSVGFPERDHE